MFAEWYNFVSYNCKNNNDANNKTNDCYRVFTDRQNNVNQSTFNRWIQYIVLYVYPHYY